MLSTLRFLGFTCAAVAIACVWLSFANGSYLLLPALGLAFVAIVFLALAVILERITRIETLLIAGSDRIKTDLGDFEKLGNVEGEATCIGCKRTVTKAGLYYHKALDVYYHPECLTRDRSP
jgi:hypothetical protein